MKRITTEMLDKNEHDGMKCHYYEGYTTSTMSHAQSV